MATFARLIESLWVTGYGAAAASGKVYFYQPGSLIPVTVYSDDATTHAITQPVSLDANGRSTVPVYVTAPARAIIQDASGITLEDIERIDGDRANLVGLVNTKWPSAPTEDAAWSLLGTSLGGTDGNVRPVGAGAVNRTLQSKLADSLSAKDFGAKGDGVTDDTAAINAALASLVAPGASVYLSPGTYLTSAPVAIVIAGTTLYGAGPFASVIKNTNAASSAIAISNVTGVTLTEFGISHATSSTAAAVTQASATPHDYSYLDISGHRSGLTGVCGRAYALNVATDNNAAGVHIGVTGDSDVYFCRLSPTTPLSIGIQVTTPVTRIDIVGCSLPQTNVNGAIGFPVGSTVVTGAIAHNFIGTLGGGGQARITNIGTQGGLRVFGNHGHWFWSDGGQGAVIPATPVAGTVTIDLSKGNNFLVVMAVATTVQFQIGASGINTAVRHPDDRLVVLFQNPTGGGLNVVAGTNVTIPIAGIAVGAAQQIAVTFLLQANTGIGRLVVISTGGASAIT